MTDFTVDVCDTVCPVSKSSVITELSCSYFVIFLVHPSTLKMQSNKYIFIIWASLRENLSSGIPAKRVSNIFP